MLGVEKYAAFLAEAGALDALTQRHAILAVFDLAIAAIAGASAPAASAALRAARSSFGGGDAPVWFSTDRLSAPGAAFANSAAASALDLDDGHRAAVGHPGASIIPAALATAEMLGSSSADCLRAIALGYEIAIRVASARDVSTLDTMVSGPWVGYGAAAAAGVLRGLTRAEMGQALALAGASAPNLTAVGYSQVMGNHLKEGIPWSTATGLVAVDLAAAGFTGPVDILDNAAIYDPTELFEGLGSAWAIKSIYFKPYACCRWAHAAIDAALMLQRAHGLAAADFETIDIAIFAWAMRLNNERAPQSLESAQYSVPFCVALALTHGPEALLRIEPAMLSDAATLALSRRITLTLDNEFEAMFPGAVPARVTATAKGARLEQSVLAPLGEPSNPLDWQGMEKKFEAVAGFSLGAAQAAGFRAAFVSLAEGELAPLLAMLKTPPMGDTAKT